MAFKNDVITATAGGSDVVLFTCPASAEASIHTLFLDAQGGTGQATLKLTLQATGQTVTFLDGFSLADDEPFAFPKAINMTEGDELSLSATGSDIVALLSAFQDGATGTTASFNPRGEYDNTATYDKLDVVSVNGTSFIAINDNISGDTPPSTNWMILAEPDNRRTDQEIRDLFLSAGDLSYNSSTGEFSFEIDNLLTGGTGVTYSSGDISIGQDVSTSASVTFLDAEFTGTGAVELPEGTEGQRPGTPASGMIRFNSDAGAFEGYNGSEWGEIGGGGAANGLFSKTDSDKVAWTKTGNGTAETSQIIYVEVGGGVLEIASGTSISMPTFTAGTDYAIWVAPDGTLEADASFNVAPTAGGRRIGGFHYAPGGNASFSLNAGDGGTTPQINEFSFYDLKWRPSVVDPRGLTLVGDGAFWCGIYNLAGDHLVGPPHRHGVNPARDGNPPDLIDGSGNYPDAQPMNIFESLWYHGFRTPRVEDFQLLAFGTNEAASRGSDPGTTGLPGGSTDAQFTSHWGVIQSTGVIALWSNDSILSSSDQTLPNPSRGNRFRVVRFASLGGRWDFGSVSGSRRVNAGAATNSSTAVGGRGICDHLIIN